MNEHALFVLIGPLQDPVTWYGINYTGTQITQRDFQNKRTLTSPAQLSLVLKVPLRHLRPSVIYSVPCDRILQRAYSFSFAFLPFVPSLSFFAAGLPGEDERGGEGGEGFCTPVPERSK